MLKFILLLHALWLCSIHVRAAAPLTSNYNCPYEPLPSTLDQFGYLEFNDELHVQGSYYYDFSIFTKDITFTLRTESAFRLYVAPHAVDVDLWLYPATGSSSITHTSDIGGDEVIFATLPAGQYRLRLLFFGMYKMNGVACPTLTLELAIVPTSRISQRVASYGCPSSAVLPSSAIAQLGSALSWKYDTSINDSTTAFNVQDQRNGTQRYAFLQAYPFTLPAVSDIGDAWEFEATLFSDFITSGALGLLVQEASAANPVDLSCADIQNCTAGIRNFKGQSNIKAAFPPGDYVLWLYDALYEKNFTLAPCNPFSLAINIQHAQQVEGFLNCEGATLPQRFDEAGLMDDDGFLYFRDAIIVDLSKPNQVIAFNVTEQSYFRAYTPVNRLDVDLQLINKATGQSIAYAFQWGGEEEGIEAVILPNIAYEFHVIIFGKYSPSFCETLLLEVAIAPVSLYANIDNCANGTAPTSSPDLSALTTIQNAPFTFFLPGNITYRWAYNGNYKQRLVTQQNFTIAESSIFTVELGSNFLLGDIRFFLLSENFTELGSHRRNAHYLALALDPGSYSFNIITGDTQTTGTVTGFPPCAVYTLAMNITPQTDDMPADCMQYRSFPTSFNTPQFLGSSPKVHVAESFLVPNIDRLSTSQMTTFTVSVLSFFRIYTEPHHIDIDFILQENRTQVAWSTSFNDEEALSWVCKPGATYTLTTRYYHWSFGNHDNDEDCYTFNAEFAIVPMEDNAGAACTSDSLPPKNLIPTASSSPVNLEGDYSFTQGRQALDYSVPFYIPSPNPALFRAVLSYDFAWNDLALTINAGSSSTASIQGVIDYNKNEIEAVLLPAGNYTLHIYEPFATSALAQFELRNCVNFHLQIGLQVVDEGVVDPEMQSCTNSFLPWNLNAVPYISNLTGFTVDLDAEILVDVLDQTDGFQFTLTQQSVFRMYVPAHPTVDVDIYLRYGTLAQPGSTIQYNIGVSEELIDRVLDAGQYVVKVYYYGLGTTLPLTEDCATYHMILSVYPLVQLTAVPSLVSQCSLASVPATISGNGTYSGDYQRSLEVYPFSVLVPFVTSSVSQFSADLWYSDVSGGLSLSLLASTQSGNKTFMAMYSAGHARLNEVILPGSYTLRISDPANQAPYPSFKCANYTFQYYLNTSATLPPAYCIADSLPADLYSNSGGSTAFGGPQAGDGSIRLFGEEFVLSGDTSKRHNYIRFRLSQPSFVRAFVSVDTGNDVDFYVYANASNLNRYTAASLGWDTTENAVWLLQPQAGDYVLDLMAYRVNTRVTCNYYHFEFAIKTASTIQQELLCPSPMPTEVQQVPPETINILYGTDYNLYNDDYVFSSARIALNKIGTQFRYRITLNVAANATLRAQIGFDFLANDYVLSLSDSSGRQLVKGVSDGAETRNTYVNFVNFLQYQLVRGRYFLDITENLWTNNWNMSVYCHFFSFELAASSDDNLAPRILDVEPDSGYSLDPTAPIVVTISFSEAVRLPPSSTSLLTWLNTVSAVYLAPQSGGNATRIRISSATFDMSVSQLQIRFNGPFPDGAIYNMIVDASQFTTAANSTVFAPETGGSSTHLFYMHSCNCNGRGSCQQTQGAWRCVCNPPWSGATCSQCMPGYHASGNTCLQNTRCNATSCNGHGTCSDSAGYVTCNCFAGYANNFDQLCAQCAAGYTGYPNCTLIPDEEGTLCTAPLIPSSLDTPAFLGYNGRLHIQGEYYIDTNMAYHDTHFSLGTPSVVRIYAAPHWVDVDLWLYNADATGATTTVVEYGISFGFEEVIFRVLPPGNYMIKLRYFIWVSRAADCETVNLEIAIEPQTSVLAETQQLTSLYCSGLTNSKLPPTTPIAPGASGMSFSGTYAVLAPPAPVKKAPNYFFSQNITIAPPANSLAVLDVVVGYRFLTGDLGLLLEAGTAANHCNNIGSGNPYVIHDGCVYGENDENRNHLRQTLQAGNYILWVYEPVAQNPNVSFCSPFDFNISISYVDDTEDVFNCDAEMIPSSIDSSQFMSAAGSFHLHDRYLFDGTANSMSFNVTKRSLVRASALTASDITLNLWASNGTLIATASNIDDSDASFFSVLSPARYTLQFVGDIVNGFCPTILLEFALEPAANPYSPACPAVRGDVVPVLPPITSFPFNFGSTRANRTVPAYYAFNNRNVLVVALYSFTVTTTAVIDTAVSSNFLRSNLRVYLYTNDTLFAAGTNRYNYNHLDNLVLEAGEYQLQIERPLAGMWSTGCAQFNFELSIYNMPANTDLICTGDHIPTTLNTMRYLGLDSVMNFQSNNWRIPPSVAFFDYQNIYFNVSSPSLIRVYTEPHIIDLDIKLHLNSTGQVLTSGTNGIKTEESFVYQLAPNTVYYLQIQFWVWNTPNQIGTCPTFNMEIEVGPIVPLPSTCPNGGDSWPANFPANMPATAYSYNSIDANDHLYVLQATTGRRTHNMPFTLNAPADFYASVGYDFLYGDLVLLLYANTTKTTYYGENKPDSNVLNLQALPKGAYVLTIYEAVVNDPGVIGCSDFDFEIYVEPASGIVNTASGAYLPSTLDTISYLVASNRTHFEGTYTLFDNSGHDRFTFTLREDSLVRVQAIVTDSEVASSGDLLAPQITIQDTSGNVVGNANSYMHVIADVPQGVYTVVFAATQAMGTVSGGIEIAVQVAIDTYSHLQADLQTQSDAGYPKTCPDFAIAPILVNPDTGYFQDHEDLVTISSATFSTTKSVYVIPFTVTRLSIIFVQLGYNFLMSDLSLQLTSTNSSVKPSIFLYGRMRSNLYEIHEEIPPGSYALEIYQPSAFAPGLALPHCAEFSYSAIIYDEADSANHVDCSIFDILPYELNSANGASTDYGGPIDTLGALHLFGGSFYVPQRTQDTVAFTPQDNSLFAILTSEVAAVDIEYVLNAGDDVVTPLANYANSAQTQRLALFSVSNQAYTLDVVYRKHPRMSCPSYTLQIDMKPVFMLERELICPTSTQASLPASNIQVDSNGFASEYLSSYLPTAYIEQAITGFSYKINFSISGPSSLTTNLAFNSMVSFFNVTLTSITTIRGTNRTTSTLVSAGQWIAQGAGRSGDTTLAHTVSVNIESGNYTLSINHPKLTDPLPLDMSKSLCFPFTYAFQVVPRTRGPYISSVDPANGVDLSPFEDLVLTITFSGNLASPAGLSTASSAGAPAVIAGLYLQGSDGSQVPPSDARYVITRTWAITFSAANLAPSITYSLHVKSDQLFDNRTRIGLYDPVIFVYGTADTSCSSHGTFDKASGECLCSTGYAGSVCSFCDAGFIEVSSSGNEITCASQQCGVNTCGCDPRTPGYPQECTPLGKCSINSVGLASCECSKGYSGQYCGECAPGYTGFPVCTAHRNCTPPCVHGECNAQTGVCECPKNFIGAQCQECAPGYSGENCSDSATGGSPWSTLKAFLEITAIILAIAGAAALVVWYVRRRRMGSRYKLLSRFDDDEDDEPAGRLPIYDNRLVDEEEEDTSNRNNLRPSFTSLNVDREDFGPAPVFKDKDASNSRQLVDM